MLKKTIVIVPSKIGESVFELFWIDHPHTPGVTAADYVNSNCHSH